MEMLQQPIYDRVRSTLQKLVCSRMGQPSIHTCRKANTDFYYFFLSMEGMLYKENVSGRRGWGAGGRWMIHQLHHFAQSSESRRALAVTPLSKVKNMRLTHAQSGGYWNFEKKNTIKEQRYGYMLAFAKITAFVFIFLHSFSFTYPHRDHTGVEVSHSKWY